MAQEQISQILDVVSQVGEDEPHVRGIVTLLVGGIAALTVLTKLFQWTKAGLSALSNYRRVRAGRRAIDRAMERFRGEPARSRGFSFARMSEMLRPKVVDAAPDVPPGAPNGHFLTPDEWQVLHEQSENVASVSLPTVEQRDVNPHQSDECTVCGCDECVSPCQNGDEAPSLPFLEEERAPRARVVVDVPEGTYVSLTMSGPKTKAGDV